jgi:hypothetical protein
MRTGARHLRVPLVWVDRASVLYMRIDKVGRWPSERFGFRNEKREVGKRKKLLELATENGTGVGAQDSMVRTRWWMSPISGLDIRTCVKMWMSPLCRCVPRCVPVASCCRTVLPKCRTARQTCGIDWRGGYNGAAVGNDVRHISRHSSIFIRRISFPFSPRRTNVVPRQPATG